MHELWLSSGQFLGEGVVILITESIFTGERRCHIGVALDLNPDADKKKIIEQGDKLTIQQVERILGALKG